MKNKRNIVEAVLYGSVLVLLIILLIFSKDLRKRFLNEDDATDTTETQSQESQIQKRTDITTEMMENETEVQVYDPAPVATEVMDGVSEEQPPDAGGEMNAPVSEAPYDGENNF